MYLITYCTKVMSNIQKIFSFDQGDGSVATDAK